MNDRTARKLWRTVGIAGRAMEDVRSRVAAMFGWEPFDQFLNILVMYAFLDLADIIAFPVTDEEPLIPKAFEDSTEADFTVFHPAVQQLAHELLRQYMPERLEPPDWGLLEYCASAFNTIVREYGIPLDEPGCLPALPDPDAPEPDLPSPHGRRALSLFNLLINL